MEKVIDISTSGRVQSMHEDFFNLGFLGPQKITRASEIIFNDKTQAWYIWLPIKGGAFRRARGIGSFSSYTDARSFEVKFINACRKRGVMPHSNPGAAIGAALYKKRSASAVKSN